MAAGVRPSASCTTATGLPRNGSWEKTSTWLKGSAMAAAYGGYCSGEAPLGSSAHEVWWVNAYAPGAT